MEKEFQHAINFAKERLLADGYLTPMFHGFGVNHETGKPESIILATPFAGSNFAEVESSKNKACQMVKLAFIAHGVTKYTFISEAWVKRFKSDKDGADEFSKNPRSLENEPDRLEVLVCYYITHDKREAATFEMVRGTEGKLVGLKDTDLGMDADGQPAQLSGRMAELLPPRDGVEVPPLLRQLAQEILRRYGVKGN